MTKTPLPSFLTLLLLSSGKSKIRTPVAKKILFSSSIFNILSHYLKYDAFLNDEKGEKQTKVVHAQSLTTTIKLKLLLIKLHIFFCDESFSIQLTVVPVKVTVNRTKKFSAEPRTLEPLA